MNVSYNLNGARAAKIPIMAFCSSSRSPVSSILMLLLAVVPASPLCAQTPEPLSAAASTITPEALARHVQALAADSFQGRRTPSPALERTARYVADQFARLGLTGPFYWDGNAWVADTLRIQRYAVPGQQRLDYAQSTLTITTTLLYHGKPVVTEAGGPWPEVKKAVTLDFRTTARFATEVRPRMSLAGERPHVVTLLSGPHTLASVRQAQLHQQVVLYVLPRNDDSTQQQQVLAELAAENDVLLLRDDDSAGFAQRRAAARAHPPQLVDEYLSKQSDVHTWIVEVWPEAVRPVLAGAGLEWATLRAATTPEVRPMPFTEVSANWTMAPPDSAAPLVTAPIVAGVLAGTGVPRRDGVNFPGLYLVISAPLDEGPGRNGAGNSGADHSDTVARAGAGGLALAELLTLAQAFSQPGLRPRYSVLFLATSGAGPGLWGSSAFLQSHGDALENGFFVSHLGLDPGGPGLGDSVQLAGLEDFEFAVSPRWTLSAHPELGLTVVPDDSAAARPADHLAFARRGVPSLSLRSGGAGDMHAAARVVQAALYLGWELANAERRPRWTAAGRRRYLPDGAP